MEDRLQTIERLLKAANSSLDDLYPRPELSHGALENPQISAPSNNTNISAAEDCEALISGPSGSSLLPTGRKQQKLTSKPTIPLPRKDVAYELLALALEDACALHRFVHEPIFYAWIGYIYDTPVERLIREHRSTLALFYAALALGRFFAHGTGIKSQSRSGIKSGSFYFDWALKFLNVDECQDLVSLQALCFIVLFLQSSGQLERCYTLVGVALRSAVALGLHRRPSSIVNPVEAEIGRRVFWVIWRVDIYSSSMLGIPPLLSTDLVDQTFPKTIRDMPYPADETSLLAGGNAHTKLTLIMPNVMRLVKVLKRNKPSTATDLQGLIDRSGLVEVERQLRTWFQGLPPELIPGGNATPRLERVRQLLRIAYAYVQMVLYEPLVQYMPRQPQGFVDPLILDYVMKYASVTRNIVSTGVSIHKTHVANYSSRSTMISTTYSAILSLIVFILNVPAPSGVKGAIFKETLEGRMTLEELSARNNLADQYVQKLNVIMGRFQDRPQPLPFSVSESTVPRTEAIYPPASWVAGRGNDEAFSSQTGMAAPEWPAMALHSQSLPAHYDPSHAPGGYVFDYTKTTAPIYQSDFLGTDHQVSTSNAPEPTHPWALDFYPLSEQQNESQSQLFSGDLTTLGISQFNTACLLFPDYSASAPMPYQQPGLSHPVSFTGQQTSLPEPVFPVSGLAPEVDYAGRFFETGELTAEQIWDNILFSGVY